VPFDPAGLADSGMNGTFITAQGLGMWVNADRRLRVFSQEYRKLSRTA
jgi:hypothetical protein